MLIDRQATRQVLRRIVFKITADRELHEDLNQEALLHLWLRETERPGQTESWYLQSCRFFLQNYLRNGRSVDSGKRPKTFCLSAGPDACPAAAPDAEGVARDSVVALASAREIAALLLKGLPPLERKILSCLAEGAGVRETATRLKITHTSVIRYRRRIASLALRLGIEPLPKTDGRPHRRAAKGCHSARGAAAKTPKREAKRRALAMTAVRRR